MLKLLWIVVNDNGSIWTQWVHFLYRRRKGWLIFHPTALSLGGVPVRDDVANAITKG